MGTESVFFFGRFVGGVRGRGGGGYEDVEMEACGRGDVEVEDCRGGGGVESEVEMDLSEGTAMGFEEKRTGLGGNGNGVRRGSRERKRRKGRSI